MSPVVSVEKACAAAQLAAPVLARMSPSQRADLLVVLADALDEARDRLVPIAMTESHLPQLRLSGEVGRASGQLRLMAATIREGSYLGVVIDPADPTTTPPRPDLRRMQTPLGPVAVFAASNFPFAFSVLGNDTASALAAGCSVVVKPNPGHPQLSATVMAVAQQALSGAGAPSGMLTMIDTDVQAGIDLVNDDRINAVAFTGSQQGGLALAAIAAQRPRPVPFFGELGSINPIIVTAAALAERRDEIATGFIGSFTLGAGQFCTKPGVLIVPRDQELHDLLAAQLDEAAGQAMLTDAIQKAFVAGVNERMNIDAVEVIHVGHTDPDTREVTPTLLSVSASHVSDHPALLDECFGPMAMLVEYDTDDQLAQLLDELPGVLAAGVQAQGDEPQLPRLLDRLASLAGRVLFNEWPTGVAVTWAMQHGGPFPASTRPDTTSVGSFAIDRFLRPVAWQSIPDALLPVALQEANPWKLPRRVDSFRSGDDGG